MLKRISQSPKHLKVDLKKVDSDSVKTAAVSGYRAAFKLFRPAILPPLNGMPRASNASFKGPRGKALIWPFV